MAFVPPAAGAGAEVLLAGLGILALASLIVAVAVQAGYQYTIGHLLEAIASALDAATIPIPHFHIGHPLKPVARQVRRANNSVFHLIGVWIAVSEKGAVYLFHGMARVAEWMAHETASLAKSTFHALRGIDASVRHWVRRFVRAQIRATVRAMVAVAVRPISRLAHKAYALAHGLERYWAHRLRVFARGIDRLRKTLTKTITKSLHGIRAAIKQIRGVTVRQAKRIARLERLIAAAGGASLAGLRARVGRLERDVAGIKAATGSLVGVGVAAATVAAVWAVLARMGLGFLRCRNVKRTGTAACGMPTDFLEDLFAGMALFGGVVGIREFVHACQDGTHLLVGGIQTMLPDDGAPTGE